MTGTTDGPERRSSIAYAAELLARDPRQLTGQQFGQALLAVRQGVAKRFPALTAQDLEDIASTAAERFVTAVAAGRVSQAGNPAGYLLRIAGYAAVDLMRRKKPELLLDVQDMAEVAPNDDAVAREFDQVADAEMVRAMLLEARKKRDVSAFRVGSYMLDALAQDGVLPSSRQCGQVVGLSHTAVAKALLRLRAILNDLD